MLMSRCDLYTENYKGASFCNKIHVGGVMVHVLSTSSVNALYLYQVLPKYLIGFRSYGPRL